MDPVRWWWIPSRNGHRLHTGWRLRDDSYHHGVPRSCFPASELTYDHVSPNGMWIFALSGLCRTKVWMLGWWLDDMASLFLFSSHFLCVPGKRKSFWSSRTPLSFSHALGVKPRLGFLPGPLESAWLPAGVKCPDKWQIEGARGQSAVHQSLCRFS